MSLKYDFKGKVVLVTGSSSGIGAAIALLFAKSGADVVVTGRNAHNVSKIAKQCSDESSNGSKVLEVVADISDEKAIDELLDKTINTFGNLDILVNNAGILDYMPITASDYMNKYKQVLQINLNSVIYLTHKSVQHLEKTKGIIINISSGAGIQSCKGMTPYNVSKAGLDMFSKCMASELGPKGIRVNSVNCGGVRTNILRYLEMTQDQIVHVWNNYSKQYPVGRVGDGLDIANTVAFLASEQASFITGSLVVVDGGHLVANCPGGF